MLRHGGELGAQIWAEAMNLLLQQLVSHLNQSGSSLRGTLRLHLHPFTRCSPCVDKYPGSQAEVGSTFCPEQSVIHLIHYLAKSKCYMPISATLDLNLTQVIKLLLLLKTIP